MRRNSTTWIVRLLAVIVLWSGTAVAQTNIPFVETFEDDPSEMANVRGVLHGQHGWIGDATNMVLVTNTVVRRGTNAASIDNAIMSHTFTNVATNVWIDFYGRPLLFGGVAPDTNSVAEFYINAAAQVVTTGTNGWVTNATTVATNEWTRFTANLDYGAKKWSLYVCDNTTNALSTVVATNMDFQVTATNLTNFSEYLIYNKIE